MEDIYNKSEYLKILLSIFLWQKDKTSTITEITKYVYVTMPPKGNITQSAEYSKTMRYIKELESKNVIQKVKPSKPRTFKTHYQIDIQGFSKLIIDFFRHLPLYGSRDPSELFSEADFSKNKNIQIFFLIYYRLLAIKMVYYEAGMIKSQLKDDTPYLDAMKNFNLSQSIFIIIDKFLAIKFPDEKMFPEEPHKVSHLLQKFENEIKKTKKEGDEERYEFLIFIQTLIDLRKNYWPYAHIYGIYQSLNEYMDAIIYEKIPWEKDLLKFIDDPDLIFKYHGCD